MAPGPFIAALVRPTPSPTTTPDHDTVYTVVHSSWFWPVVVAGFLLVLAINGALSLRRRRQ